MYALRDMGAISPAAEGRPARRAPAPRRGEGLAGRALLAGSALAGCACLAAVVATPLDLQAQAALAAGMLLASAGLARVPGPQARLALVLVSVAASGRYLWWRVSATLSYEWTVDAALGALLLAAELYCCAVLLLAYGQSLGALRRRPVPLPDDPARWPSVDVFIPTYDEPIEVVRATVLAAAALDWPADRLRVHLLDDGGRAAFRAFAAEAGVGYLVREDHAHAKAGNLNHALRATDGELVAARAEVLRGRVGELFAGVEGLGMAYDQNLSFFTFGHGGYFSPQQFVRGSAPVGFRRDGALRVEIAAAPGIEWFEQAGAPALPSLDGTGAAGLQAALPPRQGEPLADHPSQAVSGTTLEAHALLGWARPGAFEANVSVAIQQAPEFQEVRGMLTLRYGGSAIGR